MRILKNKHEIFSANHDVFLESNTNNNFIRRMEYKVSVQYEENAKSDSFEANQLKSTSKNSDSELRSSFKSLKNENNLEMLNQQQFCSLRSITSIKHFLITKTAIHRSRSYFEELHFLN